jgi:hypothetical protein
MEQHGPYHDVADRDPHRRRRKCAAMRQQQKMRQIVSYNFNTWQMSSSVLPRGRNFGRKKGPKKIVWGRKSLGPNICLICPKRAGKGPNFFLKFKTAKFLTEN